MIDLVAEAGLEDRIKIESAGTGAYHVGERADSRSRGCAPCAKILSPSSLVHFQKTVNDGNVDTRRNETEAERRRPWME